jgi:hypothetical protein
MLGVAMFLAACSSTTRIGGGAGSAVVPPATSATGPRWEHFCGQVVQERGYEEEVAKLLDTASAEGWELVGVDGELFCFKRPRG